MIRIKVQYDNVRHTFKLIDAEFKTLLEGDAIYDLQIPLLFENEVDLDEWTPWFAVPVAHA